MCGKINIYLGTDLRFFWKDAWAGEPGSRGVEKPWTLIKKKQKTVEYLFYILKEFACLVLWLWI